MKSISQMKAEGVSSTFVAGLDITVYKATGVRGTWKQTLTLWVMRKALSLLKLGKDTTNVRAVFKDTVDDCHSEMTPIDMLIFCPKCDTQHVDVKSGAWRNPPHRSHLCCFCKHVWRVADVPTNGTLTLHSKGKADGSPYPGTRK